MTFNGVITSLEEITIGKVVQETHLPAGPLFMREYQIYGRSHPMNDLKDNYFDYFGLVDRHTVIFIGDVLGHVVAKALLMFKAKSIIKIRLYE